MLGRIFNRWIFEKFGKFAAIFATVFSIVIIYTPIEHQKTALICFLVLLLVTYVSVVFRANFKRSTKIKIGNTRIIIKQGDLFEEDGAKIIPMNEYFDVDIEHGIVDPNSLHGQYIKNYASKNPEDLYNAIVTGLQAKKPQTVDQKRPCGKQIKYKLGTIYDDKRGFLLLAYSKFDKDNRAFLNNDDIVQCYTNMWHEIDIIRGTRSIAFPILGAGGVVRFSKEYTPQQLIELILWSFRISGVHLSRNATLTITVHESIVKDIDFLKLTYYSD